MSKPKKKRTKAYTGRDAATGPVVHRYTAQVKSPAREWWDSHKRAIKIGGGIGGGALLVGWLLFEFIRMLVG